MKPIRNKKATFNYEVLETYTAGIKLAGHEVKALKTGAGASLRGSFVVMHNDRPVLRGMHISPYQSNNGRSGYNPTADRELLLRQREIDELTRKLATRGLTLVPLSIHNTGGRIRVDIALVRGKKKHDKRSALRARTAERHIARTMKRR